MGEPLSAFQGVMRGVPTYVGRCVAIDGEHGLQSVGDGSKLSLILAPRGRDAAVARNILLEAGLLCEVCDDLAFNLIQSASSTAPTWRSSPRKLSAPPTRECFNGWVETQPPWSDFPFILLTGHGGGVERNPTAALFTEVLGNVTFLERPFHPTTLISVVQTGLRGRETPVRMPPPERGTGSPRHQERTGELAAANRQLLAQIEEREKVETTLRQMQRLEAVRPAHLRRGARLQQPADRGARQHRVRRKGPQRRPSTARW